MKEGGTSLNKTFREYNLVFKGLTVCSCKASPLTHIHSHEFRRMIKISILYWTLSAVFDKVSGT